MALIMTRIIREGGKIGDFWGKKIGIIIKKVELGLASSFT